MAYYRLDPWDSAREDLRAGIVSSTIANVHRGKNGRPFTPSDFMPKFDKKESEPHTPQDNLSGAENMKSMMEKFHNPSSSKKG